MTLEDYVSYLSNLLIKWKFSTIWMCFSQCELGTINYFRSVDPPLLVRACLQLGKMYSEFAYCFPTWLKENLFFWKESFLHLKSDFCILVCWCLFSYLFFFWAFFYSEIFLHRSTCSANLDCVWRWWRTWSRVLLLRCCLKFLLISPWAGEEDFPAGVCFEKLRLIIPQCVPLLVKLNCLENYQSRKYYQ